MKPTRASGRASTQGPKSSTRGRKKGQKIISQDAGPSSETAQESQRKRSKSQQTRKRRVEHATARKFKGQEKWKPLPKTSINALESILDLSILSILTMRRKDKEECQRHLNQLKGRFLVSCAQLKVPPRKQGSMLQVSRLHQAESKKRAMGRTTLQTLENEVSAVVGALEQMEGRMEGLEQKNRTMRARLENEEERAQELLGQGVLILPALPPHTTRECTLQEQMLRMVKYPDAAARAVGALLSSARVREVRAFVDLAQQQVDQLLLNPSPAVAPQDSDVSNM
ncbi:hypothetical protein AAFF_G00193640 [Aldrovandia affinis]|uniref:Centromere protein Q n=1 Tax=Aldrovandia affinis TaxID=143900 RepID=A0AAD7WVF2_9TELE|nr:hypothetical protein AAFF_G00193640 [Aldrovandia affinis]